jgi:hypothetical protein
MDFMETCSSCNGEGKVYFEEGGKNISDDCYHCLGCGKVDSETAHKDRIAAVASTMAYEMETEYRKERDEDPDGEGYAFIAAEHMMSPPDFFKIRCWDREEVIGKELSNLSYSIQVRLIDKYNRPESFGNRDTKSADNTINVEHTVDNSILEELNKIVVDDEIPF